MPEKIIKNNTNEELTNEEISKEEFDDEIYLSVDKILAKVIAGQKMEKENTWKRGLPWYYIDKDGDIVADYGNNKIVKI